MTRYATGQDHVHPLDRRDAVELDEDTHAEFTERRLRTAEQERKARYETVSADEAECTDTVTFEEASVPVHEWFGGGLKRDRFGNPELGADGQPKRFNPAEKIPATIPAEAVAALLGRGPTPTYDTSPSPEDVFRKEAQAEEARRSIRDRFEAIRKTKAAQEAA